MMHCLPPGPLQKTIYDKKGKMKWTSCGPVTAQDLLLRRVNGSERLATPSHSSLIDLQPVAFWKVSETKLALRNAFRCEILFFLSECITLTVKI